MLTNDVGMLELKKEAKDDGEGILNGNGSAGGGSEASNVVKANKGMILRKSVEYIRCVFPPPLPSRNVY